MVELINLARLESVVHEVAHDYFIRSAWLLHRLATDVPLRSCVINLPSTFAYNLDLSNFH